MQITLKGIGKKYLADWIFRNIDLVISPGEKLALLGSNGSGKTTLLQLISGEVLQSEGEIRYESGNQRLAPELVYSQQVYVAPYLDMIEEYTLYENIRFFSRFKTLEESLTPDMLLQNAGLGGQGYKKLEECSSGMKQRLRLVLGFFSTSPLLLMDEPLTNLDPAGISWYQERMQGLSPGRTVVVCSNHSKAEITGCSAGFDLSRCQHERYLNL
jgi:ABC-type multidrug transport system ATPase subunit